MFAWFHGCQKDPFFLPFPQSSKNWLECIFFNYGISSSCSLPMHTQSKQAQSCFRVKGALSLDIAHSQLAWRSQNAPLQMLQHCEVRWELPAEVRKMLYGFISASKLGKACSPYCNLAKYCYSSPPFFFKGSYLVLGQEFLSHPAWCFPLWLSRISGTESSLPSPAAA